MKRRITEGMQSSSSEVFVVACHYGNCVLLKPFVSGLHQFPPAQTSEIGRYFKRQRPSIEGIHGNVFQPGMESARQISIQPGRQGVWREPNVGDYGMQRSMLVQRKWHTVMLPRANLATNPLIHRYS